VSVRKRQLTTDEISQAFAGKAGEDFPVILSPAMLAALLQLSPKTIYEWIARGRLDGSFRKRGKHVLFWRDRVLDILFNGKDWSSIDESV
jgi:excisionase family DNA binding protein